MAADRIRAGILSGEFPRHSLLPPERDLARALGLNRLTLRAALAHLEGEGLVRARQGEGVRVLDMRRVAGVEVLAHLVAAAGRTAQRTLVRDFLELRRALAVEAVALATERASEADLQHLEELTALQDAEADAAAFAARDLVFGRAVLRAAQNLPMELLLNSVERLYRARPEIARALLAEPETTRASYRAVVALVRAGNPDVARAAVRTTLEAGDARALARLEGS